MSLMTTIQRSDLEGWPDALLAFDNGTDWEYEPGGCAPDGLEWANRCDDCGEVHWYRTWTFQGILIEKGEACYTTWTLDDSGDYQCELDEDGYDETADWLANRRAYDQYVLDTGTDPLGEYFVAYTSKRTTRWQFCAQQSIGGIVLHYVRKDGRGPRLTGEGIPTDVREFLCLRAVRPGLDYIDGFDSVEDLKGKAHEVTWQRARALQVLGRFPLASEVPRSVGAIARDLRRLARG